MTNPNYTTYLGTALQLQRWRDFLAHAAAYGLFNLIFVAVWAATGRGWFWPALPLVGWGIGLTFQHHANTWLGPITDADVERSMRQKRTESTPTACDPACTIPPTSSSLLTTHSRPTSKETVSTASSVTAL